MIWRPVKSIEDIPDGEWLVQLSNGKMATAHISRFMQVIGGKFHFDMQPVVAYMALPQPYVEAGDETNNIPSK